MSIPRIIAGTLILLIIIYRVKDVLQGQRTIQQQQKEIKMKFKSHLYAHV